MREIQFRGLRTDGKGMIYGNYHEAYSTFYIFNTEQIDSPDNYEVLPESIGQYTGLKDKNGTKIFEHDIVASYKGLNSYEITFKNGCFMWGVDDFCGLNITEDLEFQEDDLSKCEVIGNIHETK